MCSDMLSALIDAVACQDICKQPIINRHVTTHAVKFKNQLNMSQNMNETKYCYIKNTYTIVISLLQGQRSHDADPVLEPGLPAVRGRDGGWPHPHPLRRGPRRQHCGYLQERRARLHGLPEAGEPRSSSLRMPLTW